ncbi:MAG: hypothetical protein ACYTG5_21505 [Planctomycetota bacterium]|jgi:hypothetical protein
MAGEGLTAKHLRWIVVGVLGIAFMILFREELSDLIKGAEKVEIGPDGISITTRTTTTPLGETIVSGPPTRDTAGIRPQTPPSYRSPKGFAINWPQDGSWTSHPQFARMIGTEIAIAYNRTWGSFVPNVNVTIEPSLGLSIKEWLTVSNSKLQMHGFSLESCEVDERANSAVRIVRGGYSGMTADLIQRVILHEGRAYIATAARPLQVAADPQLWRDLNQILNSFRVL